MIKQHHTLHAMYDGIVCAWAHMSRAMRGVPSVLSNGDVAYTYNDNIHGMITVTMHPDGTDSIYSHTQGMDIPIHE